MTLEPEDSADIRGSDTLVLTYCDDRYAELGAITNPSKERYAESHGYDYSLRTNRPRGDTPPLWHKLILLHQMLERYKRVLWLDADIMVTNHTLDLDRFSNGGFIHFSQDWGSDSTTSEHFSCGAYLVCGDASRIVSTALKRVEFTNSSFGDQDAFRAVFRDYPKLRGMFSIHPRRTLNSVHPEVDPSVVEPWQPGDFLCHFTMVSMERRIELAKKTLPSILSKVQK